MTLSATSPDDSVPQSVFDAQQFILTVIDPSS